MWITHQAVQIHGGMGYSKEMPLDRAALLGCAVITGAGAIFNDSRVRPGESVAVIGAGGIGLAAINAAKIAGAGQILAIDEQLPRDVFRHLEVPTEGPYGQLVSAIRRIGAFAKIRTGGITPGSDIPAIRKSTSISWWGTTWLTLRL